MIMIPSSSSNYSNGMQTVGPLSKQQQQLRTPVAWFQRDINLTQTDQRSRISTQTAQPIMSQRPSSPSLTTTSSDDREEVPMVRHQFRKPNNRPTYAQTVDRRSVISKVSKVKAIGHQIFPQSETFIAYPTIRTGTVRSSRSVPGFVMAPVSSTWDGEPCPLHGCGPHPHTHSQPPPTARPVPIYPTSKNSQKLALKKFNSMVDLRANGSNLQYPVLPFFATINRDQIRKLPPFHPPPPPPSQIIPYSHTPLSQSHHNLYFHQQQQQQRPFPLQQKRPSFVPSFSNGMQIGDQIKLPPPLSTATLSRKNFKSMVDYNQVDDACCKGHLIVLWIILVVVTIGVISGVILGITV